MHFNGQTNGKIERVKSRLGTWHGPTSGYSSERTRLLPQITAIKFLGYLNFNILGRQTKVTQKSKHAIPCQAFGVKNQQ